MKVLGVAMGWLVLLMIFVPVWARMRARQKRRVAIECALLRRAKELEGEDGEW